jgi:hypothetical protein
VLCILEVFETQVGTCEAEGGVKRGENRPAEAMARARLQRGAETFKEDPVEITSRQQSVICATIRPARRRRIAFDGPTLSR